MLIDSILLAEVTESHTRWTSVQNLKNLEKSFAWTIIHKSFEQAHVWIVYFSQQFLTTNWMDFIYLFIFDRWQDRLCTTLGSIS